MDNIALPPSSSPVQSAVGVAAPKTQEQQADVKAERVPVSQHTTDKPLDGRDQEQARFEAVKRAAQAVASNPFPVSDVRFTIYKEFGDSDAIYVTRFTSLEDGKVTTVREHDLLASAGSDIGTLLTASV